VTVTVRVPSRVNSLAHTVAARRQCYAAKRALRATPYTWIFCALHCAIARPEETSALTLPLVQCRERLTFRIAAAPHTCRKFCFRDSRRPAMSAGKSIGCPTSSST
jgi:hypothetical protein